MSRSKRGSKAPGFEFWSKRGNSIGKFYSCGKYTKHLTHKRERDSGKKIDLE